MKENKYGIGERAIKFRAWDNDSREIHELFELCMESEYQYYEDHWEDKQRCKTSTLMQYTGLKDKNGKEIYEGDIIKHLLADPPEHNGFVIEFINFKYLAVNISDGSTTKFDDYFERCEIIGNIFENPELL